METDIKKTCFFCGHSYQIMFMPCAKRNKLEKRILAEVEKAYRLGYRYFFSSGNLGFDAIAAKIAADFRDGGHPDAELHLIAYDDGRQREWADIAEKGFPSIFTRADSVDYPRIDGAPAPSIPRLNSMVMRSSMAIFYYDFGVVDHVASIYTYFRLVAEEGMRLINLWEGYPDEEVFGPRG